MFLKFSVASKALVDNVKQKIKQKVGFGSRI